MVSANFTREIFLLKLESQALTGQVFGVPVANLCQFAIGHCIGFVISHHEGHATPRLAFVRRSRKPHYQISLTKLMRFMPSFSHEGWEWFLDIVFFRFAVALSPRGLPTSEEPLFFYASVLLWPKGFTWSILVMVTSQDGCRPSPEIDTILPR